MEKSGLKEIYKYMCVYTRVNMYRVVYKFMHSVKKGRRILTRKWGGEGLKAVTAVPGRVYICIEAARYL